MLMPNYLKMPKKSQVLAFLDLGLIYRCIEAETKGKQGPTSVGLPAWVSVPCSFARRMQDIESDTGYDTRRRCPDGALARLSQTTVYDTC